jgi:uncharacterized membrane protein
MTQRIFSVVFMLVSLIILLTLSELDKLDYVAKFSFVIIVIAFSAGQYSTKFPKTKK